MKILIGFVRRIKLRQSAVLLLNPPEYQIGIMMKFALIALGFMNVLMRVVFVLRMGRTILRQSVKQRA